MKCRSLLAPVAFTAAMLAVAAPAGAVQVDGGDCHDDLGAFSPTALDCAGWFTGNVLSNSDANDAILDEALGDLGVEFTDFNDYVKIDDFGDDPLLEFGMELTGLNIIGIHFGAQGGGFTGFFLFDFDTPTSSITTTFQGASGGLIVPGAVPEPGTWAMMLLGFGAIGMTIRRSRRRSTSLPQAA